MNKSSVSVFLNYIFDFLSYIYYIIGGRGLNSLKNIKMKTARAEADLSQEQLSEITGVTRQTINLIEMGNYNPSLKLCIAICKALNKSLNDLFWEE